MNAITKLIQQKTKEIKVKKSDQQRKQMDAFGKRVEELKPMLEALKEGLAPFGLTPQMHTNQRHYPCPAIHIKNVPFNGIGGLHDKISEIFISNHEGNKWHAGSCNMHRYKCVDDEALIEHVVKYVSESQS